MLIFDRFPSVEQADAFASQVTLEHAVTVQVFDSQDESNKVDIFPFHLDPPIVLVPRMSTLKEQRLAKQVKDFGGEFAGT